MKITKFLAIALCGLFFSCSTDSTMTQDGAVGTSSHNSARLIDTKVTSLAKEFVIIAASSAWHNQKVAIDQYADMMKYNYVEFQSVSQFSSWLSANIASTKFTSVSQGQTYFNAMVSKTTAVRQQYSSFFGQLVGADVDQLVIIFKPIKGFVPVTPVYQTTSCIDNCINAHLACSDSALASTSEAIASENPMIASHGQYALSVANKACDAGFQTCAGGCPVPQD